MMKISEVIAKSLKDGVLLMDLFTDVKAALNKHGIEIDAADVPDLTKVMQSARADLAANLTRAEILYAQEGRFGGILGAGL